MPGKPGQPGPSTGNHISLLRLLPGYLSNPEAFARTAPPARPPLPLAFRCRRCRAPAEPDASTCGKCGELFYFPNSHQNRSR